MTVNQLLSSLAFHKDADDTLLDNVWALAERSNDVELLVMMLEQAVRVTDQIRTAAVARKEAEVRIAYLGRVDTASEDRARLLEAERRSEVFAGLMTVAKSNADLGTRLAEQLAEKPTKVLARVVLREEFDVKDSTWIALRAVSSDKKMARPLEHKVVRAAARFASDQDRCAEMVGFLPDQVLITLEAATIPGVARLQYLERLYEIATHEAPRWDWDLRHRASRASVKILEFAQITDLASDVLVKLSELSGTKEFETAEPVAAVLAGRLALVTTGEERYRLQGLNATGADVGRLIEFALASSSSDADQVTQGLLENSATWQHPKFEELVRDASPAVIVKAMACSRSADLLVKVWPLRHQQMPEECWNFIDDRPAVIARMVADEIENIGSATDSFRWGNHRLLDLLELGVDTSVVAALPFVAFTAGVSHYYRWSTPRIVDIVGKQVQELQREYLGSDPHLWENFNTLAASWTGSLGDLLDASRTL